MDLDRKRAEAVEHPRFNRLGVDADLVREGHRGVAGGRYLV
jgi:hypothetical protein